MATKKKKGEIQKRVWTTNRAKHLLADGKRKAQPVGKRKAKTTGKMYSEKRENRSDYQKKKRPYL